MRVNIDGLIEYANNGFVTSQFSLGLLYHKGKGVDHKTGQRVEQNYQEAAKWYKKAAEQGHIAAQFNLALMYHLWRRGRTKLSRSIKMV